MGITWWDFWEMNPRILHAYAKAQILKREQENHFMWQHNAYTHYAVMAALDKGFNGKKAKLDYPEAPFGMKSNDAEPEEVKPKLSNEDMKKVDLLFASLETMKSNFELNHKADSE